MCIRKNIEIEIEVAADIVEIAYNLPYLGSLFKLGKFALNVRDWHFDQKLAKYLKKIEDIDEFQKNVFIISLSSKDNQRIS